MRKILIFWFLGVVSFVGALPTALEKQIEEDLSGITPVSNGELREWFTQLSARNWQVIYCKIRNRQIEIVSSPVKDDSRNGYVISFFTQLGQKYSLPDTDFVVYTGDGFHEDSPYPIFAFAANQNAKKNVCLIPEHEALANAIHIEVISEFSQQHPWETKLNKGFFRGGSTGVVDSSQEYFGNDRVRAVVFSSQHPELLQADFNVIYHDAIAAYISQLPNKNTTEPFLSIEGWLAYKYLLDIDGNSSTYMRGRSILLSNSLLLKVIPTPQYNWMLWYYKCLIPYVNYVPIKNDLSDLVEAFHWLKTHDQEALQIAKNGRNLAVEIFSKESIQSYVLSLVLGYSKKIQMDMGSILE